MPVGLQLLRGVRGQRADAGDLDQAACQDAARAAIGKGTYVDRYRTRALAARDRFCEDFAAGGRVVLVRVVKASGSPVGELTLSATLWAGPAKTAGAPPQPGDEVYENQPLHGVRRRGQGARLQPRRYVVAAAQGDDPCA
ncbi:hypothetical protein AB4212_10935, partial [Streptomyces sp. 2MCAF27]